MSIRLLLEQPEIYDQIGPELVTGRRVGLHSPFESSHSSWWMQIWLIHFAFRENVYLWNQTRWNGNIELRGARIEMEETALTHSP